MRQAQKQNETRTDAAPANPETSELQQDKKDSDTKLITKAASGGLLDVNLGKAMAAATTQ